ncbi:hypothetical protein KKE60_05575 [Patescibacteria group bacterium]|nr:hypothetical protein [Patescibacteria group bacterium]
MNYDPENDKWLRLWLDQARSYLVAAVTHRKAGDIDNANLAYYELATLGNLIKQSADMQTCVLPGPPEEL